MENTTFRNELFAEAKLKAGLDHTGQPKTFNITELLSRCKTRKNNRKRSRLAKLSRQKNS